MYQNIAKKRPEYKRLYYIADAFDKHDTQIWIDEWGHVTPEGNRLVAQKMLRIIEKSDD